MPLPLRKHAGVCPLNKQQYLSIHLAEHFKEIRFIWIKCIWCWFTVCTRFSLSCKSIVSVILLLCLIWIASRVLESKGIVTWELESILIISSICVEPALGLFFAQSSGVSSSCNQNKSYCRYRWCSSCIAAVGSVWRRFGKQQNVFYCHYRISLNVLNQGAVVNHTNLCFCMDVCFPFHQHSHNVYMGIPSCPVKWCSIVLKKAPKSEPLCKWFGVINSVSVIR